MSKWEPSDDSSYREFLEAYCSAHAVEFILRRLRDVQLHAYAMGRIDGMMEIAQGQMGEIRAALGQALPSDDQIITDHVRAAYVLAGGRAEA